MRTFVQFLVRNQNNVEPLKGKNEIKMLDESEPLKNQIRDSFKHIDKHEQKEEIIGFNIVEVDSYQNSEVITHQNIFDF